MRTTIGEIVGKKFVYRAERTVLRARLQTPTVEDAFLSAHRQTRDWLADICARFDLECHPEHTGTYTNERVTLETFASPDTFAAALKHPDRHDPARSWLTEVHLYSPGEDIATCDLRLRTEFQSDAPDIDLHPPKLIGRLCGTTGLVDVAMLSDTSIRVDADGVDQLVALVNDPRRELPVVLVSEPPSIDDDSLARELAGIAHVARLDDATTWAVSHRYGKARSCYLGAVRIIPTGVTFASESSASRLILAESIARLAHGVGAERWIRRGVLAYVTEHFEVTPLATVTELRAAQKATTATDVSGRAKPAQPSNESQTPQAISEDNQYITIDPVDLDVNYVPVEEYYDKVQEEVEKALAKQLAVLSKSFEDLSQRLQERDALAEEVQRTRQEAAVARAESERHWNLAVEEETQRRKLESELEQLRRTSLGISVEELQPAHRELLRSAFATVTSLRDVLLENDRLRGDYDQLSGEYDDLRRRYFHQTAESPPAATDPPNIERPAWHDYDNLLEYLERRYAGRLVLHPRVRDRLGEGALQDPNALFDILHLLATDYVDMKRGVPGAFERYREKVRAYKSGRALTSSGAGQIEDRYACEFEGVRYRAEDHLHIRERGTEFQGRNACVYYVHDDAKDRVVVTSMPRHLDTANAHT